MRRLSAFTLALAVLALTAACAAGDNANTTNANGANANRANANANANTANANTANANRNDWDPNITEADYERRKDEFGRRAKDAGETVGSGLKDGWLHVKTKAALLAADDLRDSTINVDVDNAVVTLRGTVANAAQKAKAEQTAKGIDGVTSVRNQIAVSAGGGAGNSNNANAKS
jgi:hyperosmotically inducible periplasmic protein